MYFCLRYFAADRRPFSEKPGLIAFWLYTAGLVLWIALNSFPIGWPQLDAVYEHGLAYVRSSELHQTILFWQWTHLPGNVVFAIGALLMAWDFIAKVAPLVLKSITCRPGNAAADESPTGLRHAWLRSRVCLPDRGFMLKPWSRSGNPGFSIKITL
ncbi:hypothetical protein [Paraburkholderia sartisoli]|uniref:Uncharacterized protein n=1 Tax=Paraburkholderia sartisoli TaxID=83784 RepID=A0A1H4CVV5_9BURK|nr:hypothetical protein SAMN05192564_102516 [Paraburkholderia sartisoli]